MRSKPDDGIDIYVGSTSKALKSRLYDHRADAGRVNSRFNTRMLEVGKYNWQIIPLLTFSCDKKTIREFEKSWVEILNTDLNTYSPSDENHNASHNELTKRRYRDNIENKTYYCEVCDKSFGQKCDLRKHFNTLKHQYVYLNSVD